MWGEGRMRWRRGRRSCMRSNLEIQRGARNESFEDSCSYCFPSALYIALVLAPPKYFLSYRPKASIYCVDKPHQIHNLPPRPLTLQCAIHNHQNANDRPNAAYATSLPNHNRIHRFDTATRLPALPSPPLRSLQHAPPPPPQYPPA